MKFGNLESRIERGTYFVKKMKVKIIEKRHPDVISKEENLPEE